VVWVVRKAIDYSIILTMQNIEDPLVPEVLAYLNKFDFPLAQLIARKFKIGFTRAERILRQIEELQRHF